MSSCGRGDSRGPWSHGGGRVLLLFLTGVSGPAGGPRAYETYLGQPYLIQGVGVSLFWTQIQMPPLDGGGWMFRVGGVGSVPNAQAPSTHCGSCEAIRRICRSLSMIAESWLQRFTCVLQRKSKRFFRNSAIRNVCIEFFIVIFSYLPIGVQPVFQAFFVYLLPLPGPSTFLFVRGSVVRDCASVYQLHTWCICRLMFA